MRTAHAVLPAGVDDPARPSGGNHYDRRVLRALVGEGWRVVEHPVTGTWPRPSPSDLASLARVLTGIPDGAAVLVDGLVGSAAACALVPQCRRLRVVVLVHMPLGGPEAAVPVAQAEGRLLATASAVATTSRWTRDRLLQWYRLDPARVVAAPPGVDPAPLSPPQQGGERLLSVAAVVPGKGHDVLLAALGSLRDLPWRCRCAGSLDVDPAFSAHLRGLIERSGLDGRVELLGPLGRGALAREYADTDLLVHPSRGETYGMALVEALAAGVPVVATDVGGVGEALGTPPGGLPGVLVPPEDPPALAGALRRWLTDPPLRAQVRTAAQARRTELRTWRETARTLAQTLEAGAH